MGGRHCDDSIFVVILSVLLGDLNKAHSRMSSLAGIVSTLGKYPCDDQLNPSDSLKCVQAVI